MMLSRKVIGLALSMTVAGLCACASDSPATNQGTGGTSAGGATGGGGVASTGGAGAPSSGGTTGAGSTTTAPGSGGRDETGGATSTGGAIGLGGSRDGGVGTDGRPGAGGGIGFGGSPGSGGATVDGGAGSGGSTDAGGTQGTGGSTSSGLAKFSFFVTSIEAMRELSKNQNGFGGDLRYGQADGLAGADKICTEIAEKSMPGSSAKGWRAFLSTTTPVNAIDRIGNGPWYDRLGRLVADSKANLLQARPKAEAAIINDLPNETGTPNHQGVDNHDVLTGSTTSGTIGSLTKANTCNDWTSTNVSGAQPQIGHSWPRGGGGGGGPGGGSDTWLNAHTVSGCAASVNLSESMGGGGSGVGSMGGYGAIYCFALQP